ncbi:uncharacterized protein LOC144744635 [Ciona intestinalis]
MSEKASFARVVSTQKNNLFKRPNCLNFKTEKQIKRYEVIELLKKIGFEKSKIVGIAEMKGTKIDITCSSRPNVLELREKLANIENIRNLYLYESDHVNVVLGWVPIPFPDSAILNFLQTNHGNVDKLVQRTDKDGLKTGVRIAVMKKEDLEKQPIPSYISINNSEFYVTYNGQTVTCKYCGEFGHKQADCAKRIKDYPRLENTKQNNKEQQSHRMEEEIHPRDVTTSTPKASTRSLSRTTPALEQVPAAQGGRGEEGEKEETEKNSEAEPEKSRSKRPLSSPEDGNKPKLHSISLSVTRLPVCCPNCKTEGLSTESAKSYHCWGCSREFDVARTCCTDDLFLKNSDIEETICPICQRGMRKMPCCNTLQPEFRLEDGCYECVACQRYSLVCTCLTFNCFSKDYTSKTCQNTACKKKLINCKCGKRYLKEPCGDKPFLCGCGYEYSHGN